MRVRAVAADGEVKWGSAVVIAPNRLATACHVTRRATTIEILHGDHRRLATSQEGSIEHDLCVLEVEDLELTPAAMRVSQELAIGERVTALGFQHGQTVLKTTTGLVRALYLYSEGMVIRTSAAFDFGSSGGGLFDESGRLVGILAFKGRTGTDLHFALPVDWLKKNAAVASHFEGIDATARAPAFWEQSSTDRPAFLGAALREVREPRAAIEYQ